MADKKIIQLDETQSLENFYVPGSKDNSGNLSSMKFNLGNFKEEVDNTSNYIKSGLEEFSTEKNYYTGEYVIYNNEIYRFISYHSAGSWFIGDSEKVSIFDQLELSEFETVFVRIKSSDGNLDVNGIQISIIISGNSDNSSSDQYGNCSFNVPNGSEYTLSFASKQGYQVVNDITLTAEYKYRYINVVYQKSITGTCNLKVNFELNPFCGGNISDFDDYVCVLKSGDTTVATQPITNGLANFTGLEKGTTYTVIIPEVLNYVRPIDPEKSGTIYNENKTTVLIDYKEPQPLNKTFISLDNEIEFNLIYKYIYQDYGLYLVYTTIGENEEDITYNEIKLDNLFSDNDPVNGTWIGSSYGITKDNAVAIHVYPEELAIKGCDYFFKIEDSITNFGTSYKWSNEPSGRFTPGIPIPGDGGTNADINKQQLINNYFDGKLYTYYMFKETYPDYSSTSAVFMTGKTFEYKGRILSGFMGSFSQLKYILKTRFPTNTDLISKVYQELGYTTNEISVFTDTKMHVQFSVLVKITLSRVDMIHKSSDLASGSRAVAINIGTPLFST